VKQSLLLLVLTPEVEQETSLELLVVVVLVVTISGGSCSDRRERTSSPRQTETRLPHNVYAAHLPRRRRKRSQPVEFTDRPRVLRRVQPCYPGYLISYL